MNGRWADGYTCLGPGLLPKYFGQNVKFFAILHFESKHVQNSFGSKLFAKLNRDIGLV